MSQNFFFVLLHFRQPVFADGDVIRRAVKVPDGAEGQRALFFLQGEAGGEIFGGFGGTQPCRRLQQTDEEGTNDVAGADHPRGDAVDAGVKIIQADVDAVLITVRDDFAGDGEQIVVEDDHMVAVPADAAADVEQNFGQILQHAGNFVRNAFSGVVMAGIEAADFFRLMA